MDIYKRIDKTLDTEDVEQLKKEELVKYYMRVLSDEPEENPEIFELILLNDYFKINVDLDRLLKLLKPLIKDKSTEIEMLQYDIFPISKMSFADEDKLDVKPLKNMINRVTGELYIKTYFTKQHKEETSNNIITLSTNLFKVKLNFKNEKHVIFMKKMVDMRSSPILKKTEGNDDTEIKTAIELLKYTFNMEALKKTVIENFEQRASSYDFSVLLESQSNRSSLPSSLASSRQSSLAFSRQSSKSLSRQPSGGLSRQASSALPREDSGQYDVSFNKLLNIKPEGWVSYYDKVKDLNPKKYFNLYDELIEYFTEILLRNDATGQMIYEEFYVEFLSRSYLFQEVYITYENLRPYLDKYLFESAIEDLEEENLEEDPENELPDLFNLKIQSYIPKAQVEDIKKGNLAFISQELCLRLTDEDIDFFEDLPLMYAKDIYQDESEIKEYQFQLSQIYKPVDYYDYFSFSPQRNDYTSTKEIEKRKKKQTKEKEKQAEKENREEEEKDLKKYLNKFGKFALNNYEVILEENPHLNVKKDDEDLVEFTRDLIRIYSATDKSGFEFFDNFHFELFVYVMEKIIKKPSIDIKEVIDDIFEINIAPFKRRINKILKK